MSHDDNTTDVCVATAGLEQVRQQFEAWRQSRVKRTPISQDLWKAAVGLTAQYSICHVSKALGLNYTALKEQVIKSTTQQTSTGPVSSSTFIELPCPAPALESTMEMIKPDGAVMKIQIKGATRWDLLELGKAFLGN